MSRHKRPLNRKLRFESLEGRRLLTGNVTAKVTSANLNLNGDAQDNAITITQMGANTYCVSGQNGTTINGQAKITVSGVKNNVNIKFLNGNDTVVLTAAAFPADVNVTMGKGTDLVQVGFSNDREFGSGAVSVHHNLNITLGNGVNDEVDESDLSVGHDQNIKLGDGNYDAVYLGESGSVGAYTSEFAVQVAHDFNIALGNGNYDLVNLADLNVSPAFVPNATPAQVTTGVAPIADQSPSGGESVYVGHDFNITFGKGNGDAVTINDNTTIADVVPVYISLVTVGHDFKIVMGNGNYDNVTFSVSATGGTETSTAVDDVTESSIVDGTLVAVGHDLTITLGNGNYDSVAPSGETSVMTGQMVEIYQPFVSVGHDANIKLGSGQGDSVGAAVAAGAKPAVAATPSFESVVYFAVVVGHDFNITLGNGKYDGVELIDLYVGHNLSITEGNGLNDGVFLAATEIGANLSIKTGNGGDEVDLEYVEAYQANITTGSGVDSVSIGDSSDFAKLYVVLGAGSDELFVDTSVYVSLIANFDGGTGTNLYSGGGPVGPAHVTKSHF